MLPAAWLRCLALSTTRPLPLLPPSAAAGRCSLPSNFDTTYCYALGQAAGALARAGRTGLMATISDLNRTVCEWGVGGTPLVSLMHLERRAGK